MEIKKEKLEEIITKILEELKEKAKSETYYIVFSSPWSNLYYLALEELKDLDVNLYALVSEDIESKYLEEIQKSLKWKDIFLFNDKKEISYKEGKTIFLKLSRNNIIDIANLYSKNFETDLVKKLLSEGLEIFYWDKGLEKVTGKEPVAYKKKLLKYYEEIFNFGIYPIEIKGVKR